MTRVLMIDDNRERAQAMALECLAHGVAVRLADTLCEGVRYLLDAPVSLVLVGAEHLRLSGPEQARLFDQVAPDVPVVVTIPPGAALEERVGWETLGFHTATMPVEPGLLLAKLEPPLGLRGARPGARARVDAACGGTSRHG